MNIDSNISFRAAPLSNISFRAAPLSNISFRAVPLSNISYSTPPDRDTLNYKLLTILGAVSFVAIVIFVILYAWCDVLLDFLFKSSGSTRSDSSSDLSLDSSSDDGSSSLGLNRMFHIEEGRTASVRDVNDESNLHDVRDLHDNHDVRDLHDNQEVRNLHDNRDIHGFRNLSNNRDEGDLYDDFRESHDDPPPEYSSVVAEEATEDVPQRTSPKFGFLWQNNPPRDPDDEEHPPPPSYANYVASLERSV